MKSMALIMAVLGIMAGAVWAAPTYEYSCVSVGGGLFGHSFSVNNPGQSPSKWLVDMEWHGASGGEVLVLPGTLINQVKAFGVLPVDEEADAIVWDDLNPPPGYDMNLDTWVRSEFSHAFQGGPPIEGPNSYEVQSATEVGLVYVTAPHAYIVSDGDVAFSGWLCAGGICPLWLISGTSPVPEPTSLLLLALGACLPLRRRRR